MWADPQVRAALAVWDWQTVLQLVAASAGLTQGVLAAATGVSQPHISRLMSGRSREPGIATVRALCDGLGIPRRLAGLAPSEEDDTDRRQLIGAAVGATGLALLTTQPGGSNADQISMITGSLRQLEQHTPARALLPSAVAHAGLAGRIRGKAHGHAHARQLAGAEAEAAGLAAWLYADLDERANARRAYQAAIAAAGLASNQLLVCYMRGSLGQFATNTGAAAVGRQLLNQARAELPRSAPPIAVLWLDALEAAALAVLGERRAMVVLVDAERRLQRGSEPVWPWLFHFGETKLAGYRAIAAAHLGHHQTAEAAFALAETGAGSPKQAALAAVARASTLAAQGEMEHACQLALQALEAGRRFGSERVIHAVHSFRARLPHTVATAALDALLASTYGDDL